MNNWNKLYDSRHKIMKICIKFFGFKYASWKRSDYFQNIKLQSEYSSTFINMQKSYFLRNIQVFSKLLVVIRRNALYRPAVQECAYTCSSICNYVNIFVNKIDLNALNYYSSFITGLKYPYVYITLNVIRNLVKCDYIIETLHV